MKLSPQQAEATLRLREMQDFQFFLQALAEYGEARNKMLIMADGVNTDLIRGELRMLTHLQDAVLNADRTVQTYRQPKDT